MDFVVDQAALLSALEPAKGFLDMLLCITDDAITYRTFYGPASLSKTILCKATTSGNFSINVSQFYRVVNSLPPGQVQISATDKAASVRSGSSRFVIQIFSDFPELPDGGGVKFTEVPSHKLVDLIGKTLFSVSTDEARVNLNGALFESNGKMATMVSTDGHRLTKYSVPLEGPKLSAGIIIPRKGMEEIRKVLNRVEGTCRIGVADQHLFVEADALMLSVKLNNVAFPPWGQILHGQFQRRATVYREPLLASIRQAAVVADSNTSTVKIKFSESSAKISAEGDFGLRLFETEIPVRFDGQPFLVAYNTKYLIECLTEFPSSQVYLEFDDQLDPCVVKSVPEGQTSLPYPDSGTDLVSAIMPVRV